MPEPIQLKSKICLVGEAAVGKTSLLRRYVLDQFDDTYVRKLGAKVSKKTMSVPVPERKTQVEITMAIWDVIGHLGFRQLLGDAFFDGAQGILAVADLTRRGTLTQLPGWVQAVEGIAGTVAVVLAANKADLTSGAAYGKQEVAPMATVLGYPYFLTSAKTGENVEDAFLRLGSDITKIQLGVRWPSRGAGSRVRAASSARRRGPRHPSDQGNASRATSRGIRGHEESKARLSSTHACLHPRVRRRSRGS